MYSITEFRANFPDSKFDSVTLRGGAVLQHLLSIHSNRREAEDSDISRLGITGSNSRTLDKFLDLWSFATYASQLPGRPSNFEKFMTDHRIPQTLLSVVFWAAPTAQCAFTALETLAPEGSESRNQYIPELIQASVYRQDEVFLTQSLDYMNIHPAPTAASSISDTNSSHAFVETMLKYMGPLERLVGPSLFIRASLRRWHSTVLLNAALDLTQGELHDLGDISVQLNYIVNSRDVKACSTLVNCGRCIDLGAIEQATLVHRAFEVGFKEGVIAMLSLFQGFKRPEWVIPAILSFDPDIIHNMWKLGCLDPNVDILVGSQKTPFDYRFYYARLSIRRHKNVHECRWDSSIHWYMSEGSCYLALYLAVHLACDASVIDTLIKAGAFVMLAGFHENTQPTIIKHIRDCIEVDNARTVFSETLDQIRKRCGRLSELSGGAYDILGNSSDVLSMQAWEVIARLIDNVGNKSTFKDMPRTIESPSNPLDSEMCDREPVVSPAFPKSLQTQESWTLWREEVLPVLETALKEQASSGNAVDAATKVGGITYFNI